MKQLNEFEKSIIKMASMLEDQASGLFSMIENDEKSIIKMATMLEDQANCVASMTQNIERLYERVIHLETLLKIDEAVTLSGEKDIYKDGLM